MSIKVNQIDLQKFQPNMVWLVDFGLQKFLLDMIGLVWKTPYNPTNPTISHP